MLTLPREPSELFPFWPHLTPEQRERLLASVTARRYQKGETIHGGGAECTGAIVMISGSARAYLLSGEGREVTLYRLYPGEVCMLSASCVLKAITFDVFVDAQEDAQCLIINGKVLADISESNLYVQNYALSMAVNRFSDAIWAVQQILFLRLDQRLAVFLEAEVNQTNSNTIKLTQEQIARYMGSAREAVSRMLKYFAGEGVVEVSRGGVTILDRGKLHALTF